MQTEGVERRIGPTTAGAKSGLEPHLSHTEPNRQLLFRVPGSLSCLTISPETAPRRQPKGAAVQGVPHQAHMRSLPHR